MEFPKADKRATARTIEFRNATTCALRLRVSIQKLLLVGVVLAIGWAEQARAGIITSTAAGGVWGTPGTWVLGVAPVATDSVIIATTGAGFVTGNAGGTTYTCAGLTINSGATLTMLRPFIVNGATSITGTINFGSTSAAVRAMTFNGDVTLNSGAVWDETNGGTNAVNDIFTFAGSLTNNATTFTTLAGVHTFSGAANTLSGTIATAIPNVTMTGTYTNSGTLTVTTALAGAGALTNGATGTLNYGGAGAIVPTLTVTAVGNMVNYDGAAQTVKATTYDTLTLSGSGTKTMVAATVVNGNLTLSGTAAATTVANFAVGGNLVVGSGTAFTDAANFTLGVTGTTSVSGTLTLAGTGAKTFTGNVTVNNGGTWNETGNSTYSFAGNLQNDGTFTANAGVHTFTGAAMTFSGANPIAIPSATVSGSYTNNGALTISTALAGAGALTNGATGTLNYGGAGAILPTLTATAVGNTVNYDGAAAQTVKNTTYDKLTLSGGGIKTAAGAITANSLVTINAGVTFNMANISHSFGSLTGAGNISAVATNVTLTVGTDGTSPAAYSGVISNGTATSVALTKTGAGALTLSGANTYTGATMVNAGVLLVDGSLAAGSAVSLNGGTLGGTGTVGGAITATAAGGKLSPGDPETSPGILHTAAVTLNGTSTFKVQLDGATAGPDPGGYDQLNSTGTVALGGVASLNVTIGPTGFSPSTSTVFTIVSAAAVTGTFAGLPNGTALPPINGRNFVINYTLTTVTLTHTSQTFTWTGGAGVPNNQWSNGANWDVGDAPGAGDKLVFGQTVPMAIQKSNTNDIAAGTKFNSILFQDTPYILSGNSVTLTGGGAAINNNFAGANTIALPVVMAANPAAITCATGGALTFNVGATVDNGGMLLTVASVGTGAATFNDVISNTGGLTNTGAGTLTLSGANTYTGVTTISAGVLSVGTLANGGAASGIGQSGAGAANLVLGGGTLQYTGGNVTTNRAFTLTNATSSSIEVTTAATNLTISGNAAATTGALTKIGAGTLTLSGANAYTGATTINAGILSTSLLANGGVASGIGASGNAAGNLIVNGGTLQYTGAAVNTDRSFSVGTSGGTIDSSGAGALNFTNAGAMGFNAQTGVRTLTLTGANAGNNTLLAVVGDNTGATSLVKSGAGTWDLSGANTYTGATTVSAGTLLVDGADANSAVAVNAAATLGGIGTVGGNVTSTGGTVSPGDSAATTGILKVNGLTLDAASAFFVQLNGTVAGTNYDVLNVTGAADLANSTLNGAVAAGFAPVVGTSFTIVTTGGGFVGGRTFNGLTEGAQVTFGTRNFTISYLGNLGKNVTLTYTSQNFIWNGASLVDSNWTTGANWVGGAAPGVGVDLIFGAAGAARLANNNNFIGANSNFASIQFTNAGYALSGNPVTLTGGATALNNNFAGVNHIALPVVMATNPATITCLSGGALTFDVGATINNGAMLLTVASLGTGATTFNDVISNNGGLTNTGAGTTILAANNTYGGATTIGAGTLQVGNGGATGTLGTAAVTDNASLVFNLSGAVTVSNNIVGTGSLTQAGLGSTTLTGVNTYAGATTINTGSLIAGSTTAIPNKSAVVVNSPLGGSFTLNAATLTIGSLAGAGAAVLNGADLLTLGNDNTNTTYTGILSGPGTGSIVKIGTGTQTFSNFNTYSGGTTVTAGTLAVSQLGGTATPMGSGTVTMNGGTLALTGDLTTPLVLTGWNADVIHGKTEPLGGATNSGTTADIDGVNFIFYEAGSVGPPPQKGLPSGGVITNTSGVIYQLQPYGALNVTNPNDLRLGNLGSGTLALTFPRPFTAIHIAHVGGNANGGTGSFAVYDFTLNFSDLTTTTVTGITAPDWFNNVPFIDSNFGRMTGATGAYANVGPPPVGGNPRLYDFTYPLLAADAAKTLSSITFNAHANPGPPQAIVNIFAVTADGLSPTQVYPNNVVVTANSTINVTNSLSATMGTLSMGANTLNLTGTATAQLTLGATTLTGNPTLDQAANTTLILGALGDSGTARTIVKSDTGTLTLGTAATSLVNGTAVNITGGTLNSNNATALGALAAVDAAALTTFNVGASQTIGSLSDAGSVTLGANTLTVGNAANNLSSAFSGVISGALGGLTKAGTGTLTLSNIANTYTGATTIDAGVLSVNTLALGGAASGIGQSSNAAANLVLGGGSLQYTGATVSTDRAFTLTNLTTSSIDVATAATDLTITGNSAVVTTGALTKLGAGTLTLTGANLYTGATTDSAGALMVDGQVALGGVAVSSGATLGGAGTIKGPVTINGGGILAPGDPGAVGTLRVGSLSLVATSELEFDLNTTGNFDKVIVTNANGGTGNLTLAGDIDFFGAQPTGSYVSLITCTGTLTNNILNVRTIAGNEDAVITTNTGTAPKQVNLTVAPAVARSWSGGGLTDNWTNGANWTGGVAPLTGDSLVFPSGQLRMPTNFNDYDPGTTFSSITFSGAVGSYTLNGNPGNPLTLTFAGITSSNTSGANTVGSTLGIAFTGPAQTIGNAAGGTLTVSSAIDNAIALTVASAGTTNLNGVVSDTGSLSQTGAGSLTLAAANTYTGTTANANGKTIVTGSLAGGAGLTTVTSGVLAGTGTVQALTVDSGASVEPGATPSTTGILTAAGAAKFNAGAIFAPSIDGAGGAGNAGLNYDQLNLTGAGAAGALTIAAGAMLNVTESAGIPASTALGTNTYVIMTAASVSGTFNDQFGANLPDGAFLTTLDGTQGFTINYTATTVTLTRVPILLSTLYVDGGGTDPGVDDGDKVNLNFSMTVTAAGALIGDIGVPVTGDTWAGSTITNGGSSGPLNTIQVILQNGTVSGIYTSPLLTPAGIYKSTFTGAGSPSGVYIANGAHFTDGANTAVYSYPTLALGIPAAVDLGPGGSILSVAWADYTVGPKVWDLTQGASVQLDVAQTVTASTTPVGLGPVFYGPGGAGYAVLNSGTTYSRFFIACAPSSAPSGAPPGTPGWTLAAAPGTDQFTMLVDAHTPITGTFNLDLSTGSKLLDSGVYSGQTRNFDLQLTTPSQLTASGGVQQTITVTITITAP